MLGDFGIHKLRSDYDKGRLLWPDPEKSESTSLALAVLDKVIDDSIGKDKGVPLPEPDESLPEPKHYKTIVDDVVKQMNTCDPEYVPCVAK